MYSVSDRASQKKKKNINLSNMMNVYTSRPHNCLHNYLIAHFME